MEKVGLVKNRKRFFRYDRGNRRGDEDPEVLEIINLETKRVFQKFS